ncbi:hypothetical protein LOZ66_003116 [Ophidiomyces ophidiicola]|nr:hypothetical protein LOZ66_003116 [Ophidiomyces ophidiicola]
MVASASSTPHPSSLTTLIGSTNSAADAVAALSVQILHNLQHQHLWTSLRIHDPCSLSPRQHAPLISGFPPQTVYTHPDEQAYLLEHRISPDSVPVEREWVIPTAQGQSWTLKKLSGLFDSLPEKKEDLPEEDISAEGKPRDMKLEEFIRRKKEEPWVGKRALLAMVNRNMGGDGTVVYYVVLEGAIKPRQN